MSTIMIGSVDFRENIIDPVLSRQLIGLRPDVDVKPPDRGGMLIFREHDGKMPGRCTTAVGQQETPCR